jgi:hypothetical protein
MHLRLNAHAGAPAGSVSGIGLVLVAAAVWRAGRLARSGAAPRERRRAA